MQTVNAVFREPVQQVLEKVKNEPFFRWPGEMAGDLRNATRTCIATIIRTMDTPLRIAGIYGIT